jgi:hypothetical protein
VNALGVVLAVLLVCCFLLAVFLIEQHFSQKQREWQRILDDLDE